MTKSIVPGHFLEASLHYHLPPDHLSDELLYDVHYLFKGAMASLMLGIDGVISLENDPFGGTAALRPEMSTGVTSQFNAINRSWMRRKLNLAHGEVHGAEGYLRLESLVEQALMRGGL